MCSILDVVTLPLQNCLLLNANRIAVYSVFALYKLSALFLPVASALVNKRVALISDKVEFKISEAFS